MHELDITTPLGSSLRELSSLHLTYDGKEAQKGYFEIHYVNGNRKETIIIPEGFIEFLLPFFFRKCSRGDWNNRSMNTLPASNITD